MSSPAIYQTVTCLLDPPKLSCAQFKLLGDFIKLIYQLTLPPQIFRVQVYWVSVKRFGCLLLGNRLSKIPEINVYVALTKSECIKQMGYSQWLNAFFIV